MLYQEPEMEILKFETGDVIRTSDGSGGNLSIDIDTDRDWGPIY